MTGLPEKGGFSVRVLQSLIEGASGRRRTREGDTGCKIDVDEQPKTRVIGLSSSWGRDSSIAKLLRQRLVRSELLFLLSHASVGECWVQVVPGRSFLMVSGYLL